MLLFSGVSLFVGLSEALPSKISLIGLNLEGKEYPTPATRPHYSLLNKSKIKEEFGIIIPYWKDSLDECLTLMGERK